ncbi:LysM peptidoglycan-binding domain-containing protein [Aquifex sp.]
MNLFILLILGISAFVYAGECTRYYTVKKGDSLWEIVKKYKLSIAEIYKLNPKLKRTKYIRPGMKLCISRKKRKSRRVYSSDYILYKVRKGDTLIKIAKKFRVSVSEIKRANNLKSSRLYAGQVIKIPIPKEIVKERRKTRVKYKIYRVKRGDTLIGIAKKFNVSVSELKRVNRLKGSRIYVGQKLKIPVRVTYTQDTKPPRERERYTPGKEVSKSSGGRVCYKVYHKKKIYIRYRVRRGDSLIKIARKFGVSVRTIKRLNGLKSNRIYVGQRLKIPKVVRFATTRCKYVVKVPKVIMPVEGKIVKNRRGLTIYTECGKPVKAVADGKVIYSGNDLSLYRNMVIIEHTNFISVYAYNERNFVKLGQRVRQGQKIAEVGIKPDEGRCALHFEVRTKDGSLLNPLEFVKAK